MSLKRRFYLPLSIMLALSLLMPADAADSGKLIPQLDTSVPSESLSSTSNQSSSSPPETSPKPHSIQLIGRIEELTNETAPTPPTTRPNGLIEGVNGGTEKQTVPGFPGGFIGIWAGNVIIDKNDYGEMKTRNPEMYKREFGILFPGRIGIGQVTFSQIGENVKAVSTITQFNPTQNDLKYMDKIHNITPGTHFNVRFGVEQKNALNIMGVKQSSTISYDRTTELEISNFQQQVATSSEIIDPVTHRVGHGTQEVVLQFHQLNPRQMIVNMAQVNYASNGEFESKLIMHGTFSKQK